jgi:NAD(P)H-flavin reductase/hemoglobin-like flavoprotein
LDPARLKESFAHVAMHGDEVAQFFYSDLFLRHPETRDMFPVSMSVQRDRLLQALGRIVADAENLDSLAVYLQGLGRDHRKFGTLAEHYEPVGVSLLATVAHFSGSDWTPELAAEWKAAYHLVAEVMIGAAAEDEKVNPPYWEATVLSHERRSFDVSVFRVATLQRLPYLAGQSVAVESPRRPGSWRFYSPANAPREDGTLDFHVRLLDGGTLSTVLVSGLDGGTRLKLGPPVGSLTFSPGSRRDVLLVAGSTGLAPLRAITEQIAALADPPRVHLFFGTRRVEDLYDLPDLEKMSAHLPWLTVTTCVSDDPDYPGERGHLSDVVARRGMWTNYDAYLAGPTQMVYATVAVLTAQGVRPQCIHVEDFGWSEP